MIDLYKNTYIAANAGCGKTFSLIQRVLTLINAGVNIERIALLTFTENAAQEMKNRLTDELVKKSDNFLFNKALEELHKSNIQTINSFAYKICKTYFENTPFINPPQIISDSEFDEIGKSIFNKLWESWSNNNDHRDFFELTYQYGIDKNKWQIIFKKIYKLDPLKTKNYPEISITKRKKTEENNDQLYIDEILQYGTCLSSQYIEESNQYKYTNSVMTHDDSQIYANELLKTDFIRFNIWNKFDCVLVDEFQDTNGTQLQIIEKIIGDASENDFARLFAVGDEKQSIYSFRGVSTERISDFQKNHIDTIKYLDKTYRNSNKILKHVNTVSKKLFTNYRYITTNRNEDINSIIKYLGDVEDKNSDQIKKNISIDIVEEIKQLISSSTSNFSYEQIGIIARDTSQFNSLTYELERENIPYEVDSSGSIYENLDFKLAISHLLSICDPRETIATVGILKSSLFDLSNDELIWHVQNCSSHNSLDIWNYMSTERAVQSTVTSAFSELSRLHNKYSCLKPLTAILEIFEGAHSKYFDKSIIKYLCNLAINFELSNPNKTLFDFSKSLYQQYENKTLPIAYTSNTSSNSVKIMTIHKSKGLEFSTIFVIPGFYKKPNNYIEVIFEDDFIIKVNGKIQDSKFSKYVEKIIEKQNEEEKRLMYVALTRAKDKLFICMHRKARKSAPKLLAGTDILINAS
ncbi:MAG: UvrD-helicase domain-containing protein [Acidimicrobiia bacterium]